MCSFSLRNKMELKNRQYLNSWPCRRNSIIFGGCGDVMHCFNIHRREDERRARQQEKKEKGKEATARKKRERKGSASKKKRERRGLIILYVCMCVLCSCRSTL